MAYLFNEKLERYRRLSVSYHLPRLLASPDRKAYLDALKKRLLDFLLETEQDPYKRTIVAIVNEGYHLRTPLHKQFETIQQHRAVFLEKQLTELEDGVETEISELAGEEGDQPVLHFIIRSYTAEFGLQLIRELERKPHRNVEELKADAEVLTGYLLKSSLK